MDNGCEDRSDGVLWDFDWSMCSGASDYHLYVKHQSSTYPVIDRSDLTSSSFHKDGPGDYIINSNRFDWRWKVRAKVNGVWGDWSEERHFDVEPLDTDCQGPDCYPDLVPPELEVTGSEDYEANGEQWTRYLLAVMNWADFPDVLFQPAPDLPPCGQNPNAARSWVRIYAASGHYIYGFCAMDSASDLQHIWFAVRREEVPPEQVYIEIWDRRCDIAYTSNLASTSVVPVMDQYQEDYDYGFWFEQDVRRWQEFVPTLDDLSRIDLLVIRWGDPGDILVTVTGTEDNVLYEGAIPEEDIPRHEPYDYGSDWVSLELSSELPLVPGEKYRIHVWGEHGSPTVDNRYFWRGHTDSGYECCLSDVDRPALSNWDGYDYAFRTFGYAGR